MLKERGWIVVNLHRLLDLVLTAASFLAAYVIKKNDLLFLHLLGDNIAGLTTSPNYNIVVLMVIIIWYITFNFFGLYESYRQQTFSQIFWNIVKAVLAGFLILVLSMYFLKIPHVSRIMLAIFIVLNILVLGISKGLVYRVLAQIRKSGYNVRNVLVIGRGRACQDIWDSAMSNASSGYRIIGCLDLYKEKSEEFVDKTIQSIGRVYDIEKILTNQVVDELIFSKPLEEIENVEKYILLAQELGIDVRILPYWYLPKVGYKPVIGSIQVTDFLGIPTLTLTSTSDKYGELFVKGIIDYIGAFLGLVFCFPLFIVIAIAIKLSSKGPVFFKQERCGLNGRKFTLYKFRTMVEDAEKRQAEIAGMNEADGPAFKIRSDPRIIPYVGTFIRLTSLDELPQLINVIKGEMSLVGPRPPIPHEVEKYNVWQRRRLSMKPGMTCIWQITPNRNDIGFDEWMNMDLWYIDNWSLGKDFKILLKTIRVVITGCGR